MDSSFSDTLINLKHQLENLTPQTPVGEDKKKHLETEIIGLAATAEGLDRELPSKEQGVHNLVEDFARLINSRHQDLLDNPNFIDRGSNPPPGQVWAKGQGDMYFDEVKAAADYVSEVREILQARNQDQIPTNPEIDPKYDPSGDLEFYVNETDKQLKELGEIWETRRNFLTEVADFQEQVSILDQNSESGDKPESAE